MRHAALSSRSRSRCCCSHSHSRCCCHSSRESEELENGLELHYTQKDDKLNVFVIGLKEGENSFVIRDFAGDLQSFDSNVEIVTEKCEDGLKVIVKNYKEDMYTVGFTTK